MPLVLSFDKTVENKRSKFLVMTTSDRELDADGKSLNVFIQW